MHRIFDEQPQNPFNLRSERALSLQRQQQRLVFNALWELPIGDEEVGKAAQDNWIARAYSGSADFHSRERPAA